MQDLFPETITSLGLQPHGPVPARHEWVSPEVDAKHGSPIVHVHLVPRWQPDEGWRMGWCVLVSHVSADEWMPGQKTRDSWPWYRPDDQPCSARFGIAAGIAARAAKIVLAQMYAYAGDELTQRAITSVSEAMERQAQRWLLGEDL